MSVRLAVILLVTLVSADAFACGPYGAAPEPVLDAGGRQVALLAPMSGELTVVDADGTWRPLPTTLWVARVTVTDTTLEVLGWSGDVWRNERWSRATHTRLPDVTPRG